MAFTLPLPLLPLPAGKHPPAPLTRRIFSAKSPAREIRTAGTSTWSFMTSLLSTGRSPYASDAPSSLPAGRAPCAVGSAKALLLDRSSGAAWCGDNAASPGLPTSRTLHDLLTPPAIANSAGYSDRVPAAPPTILRRLRSHHDRTSCGIRPAPPTSIEGRRRASDGAGNERETITLGPMSTPPEEASVM